MKAIKKSNKKSYPLDLWGKNKFTEDDLVKYPNERKEGKSKSGAICSKCKRVIKYWPVYAVFDDGNKIICNKCFNASYDRIGNIPVILKIEHGKPIIYLQFDIHHGALISSEDTRSIKIIESKHHIPFDGYRFTDPYAYESFCMHNKINIEEIELEAKKNSFYGIDGIGGFSFNLTKSFIAEWWNRDCPNIYRYNIGTHDDCNILGMKFFIYSANLVETGLNGCYLNEDITEEEMDLLTAGHPDTMLDKECQARRERLKMDKNQLEASAHWIIDYEKSIQHIIDQNKDMIIEAIKSTPILPLDCGFLNVFTTDEKYNEKKRPLTQGNYSLDGISFYKSMNLRLPYAPQSLTIKKKEFDIIKSLINDKLGIDLYCTTMPD